MKSRIRSIHGRIKCIRSSAPVKIRIADDLRQVAIAKALRTDPDGRGFQLLAGYGTRCGGWISMLADARCQKQTGHVCMSSIFCFKYRWSEDTIPASVMSYHVRLQRIRYPTHIGLSIPWKFHKTWWNLICTIIQKPFFFQWITVKVPSCTCAAFTLWSTISVQQ